MKSNILNKYILASASMAICLGNTGCLQEAFPEGETQVESQIKDADKSTMVAAITAYMTKHTADYPSYDTGFSAHQVWFDSMTADMPCNDNFYDYFPFFAQQSYLGNWELQQQMWKRYYYLLRNCNNVLAVSDRTPGSTDSEGVGTALVYRAFVFMDLMRMYEFKATGVASLDQYADSEGLWGLTVPIVTETTTEAEARNNPRAPFWKMYRFVITDLNNAVKCLANTHAAQDKDYASLGVAYGMRARFWLELGSRFHRHAEDLAEQLKREDDDLLEVFDKLDIKTAEDCFRNAARDARYAINEGAAPLTQSQWFDTKNGFNTPNPSWMWAILVNANNTLASYATWQSMASYLAPEASYGVSHYVYSAYRKIDARLYDKINRNDWRRDTWINPDEAGNKTAYDEKYSKLTTLKFEDWAKYAAYTGFKFRPGSGNGDQSTVGNIFCTPLMRVEEMFFIEAEATAMTQGAAAGLDLLRTFMNTYRMVPGTVFNTRASSLEEIVDEILVQKRIELWGEGQVLWDFRRLEKAIEKGYPGTNWIEMYRFNSIPEKVAPWTTWFIPEYVNQQNPACKLNPDPSDVLVKWTENTSK